MYVDNANKVHQKFHKLVLIALHEFVAYSAIKILYAVKKHVNSKTSYL